ncbi:hypothetical protein YC2023_071293 [Brassica napus]
MFEELPKRIFKKGEEPPVTQINNNCRIDYIMRKFETWLPKSWILRKFENILGELLLMTFSYALQIWEIEVIPKIEKLCGKKPEKGFKNSPRYTNWMEAANVSYEEIIWLDVNDEGQNMFQSNCLLDVNDEGQNLFQSNCLMDVNDEGQNPPVQMD